MSEKLTNLIKLAIKDGYGLYDNADALAEFVVYYVSNGNIDNSKENEEHEQNFI